MDDWLDILFTWFILLVIAALCSLVAYGLLYWTLPTVIVLVLVLTFLLAVGLVRSY